MSTEWSARPEVAAEVGRLLAAEVRARGIRAETEAGAHAGEPRIRLDGVPVALHPLVEACAAVARAQWSAIVRAAVDDAVGPVPQPGDSVGPPPPGTAVDAPPAEAEPMVDAKQDRSEPPRPETAHAGVPPEHLEGLRGAVRARLLPEPPAGSDSWHYAHPVAPGLRLGLELAVGGTRRLLLDSELPQVPIPAQELFSAGWRNAWGEPVVESGHAPGIRELSGPYIATRVAEFGPVASRLGAAPHGLVLALPTPHLVLYHLVRRDTVLVVEELSAAAERLAGTGGLTARLYYFADGRLEPIDLQGSPSGRFADALATALI